MTTISVPIDRDLEDFIDEMLKHKKAETKAQVIRMALYKLKEEEALKDLLEAEIDVKEGRIYKGDLKELSEKLI